MVERSMLAAMLAGWLAAGAIASPPAPDEGNEIVVSLSADPYSCNLRLAREVAFARLVRDYSDLRGKCRSVRGWRYGRAIYPSFEAASSSSPYDMRVQQAVGLYGDDSLLYPGPAEPVRVAVAGVVAGCEYLPYGSAGYCHSVLEGGFLIMGEIRPLR